MYVPRKIQYALLALFELSKTYDANQSQLRSVQDISEKQGIPAKFLEALLTDLRKGEFVISYRGKQGGYHLSRPPRQISVASVLRCMQGPIEPVECLHEGKKGLCEQGDDCVFRPMWERVRDVTLEIYEEMTMEHFLDEHNKRRSNVEFNYMI